MEDVAKWAGTVGHNKLPPITPSVVPVETGTKVVGTRALGKKRCKKLLIIGIVIGVVVATVICTAAFLIHRRMHHDHFKGRVKDGDHEAEEDIRMDEAKRVIHVGRNATSHFFRLLAVLDYETKLAGFKNCYKQECYVDRLRDNYENGCAKWRHFQRHHRMPKERPLRVGPVIEQDILEYIGGEEIFAICGNLPSYWVIEVPPGTPVGNSSDIIYL